MSELRVDNIVDMGGSGAPQLRKGANVTGISTITQAVVGNATINAGGINATGIVTSSSNKFVGDLASGNITAGVMTATSSVVASNITINSGGVNASGIVSATSYIGSGANLTGVGLSIAPLMYQPDVNDSAVNLTAGIGLTFNQRVFAGTGNVTLSLVSVGSTLVENFSVGSSVTYNNDADPPNITINPTADLSLNTQYAISYPSGAFIKNTGAGSSFVGTAYTFSVRGLQNQLWMWGHNSNGQLGQNSNVQYSSPVQVGSGSGWNELFKSEDKTYTAFVTKTDGTLWSWGNNASGELGHNNTTKYSSPTQIPGTTWSSITGSRGSLTIANKTDGTLWSWGYNESGALGLNQPTTTKVSSPTQIPGTTWGVGRTKIGGAGGNSGSAIRTDGTLWSWGQNEKGQLGLNQAEATQYSSPVQIPGTTWSSVSGSYRANVAIKTDGTLWTWGWGHEGVLGQNSQTERSSPTQIPGTTWSKSYVGKWFMIATKTDGTLWSWGINEYGHLGLNNRTSYSSPIQIPGTSWSGCAITDAGGMATRTDGTLWSWGYNGQGQLGLNTATPGVSSPTQVPGTNWSLLQISGGNLFAAAMKQV